MRTRVSAFPLLSLRHLWKRSAPEGILESWYGRNATRFFQGRSALWWGIKRLGLGDTDTVLVPSYHCGVEIEAVLQAGVRAEFYRIQDDMTVDLKWLEEKITPGCRAVLVIHYYGFAQPIEAIRRLCARHKLSLIEDCAHALFGSSGELPLGTYGDLAILSLTKSLPVSDGGMLLSSNPAIATVVATERPSRAVVWKRTLGLLVRSLDGKWHYRIPLAKFSRDPEWREELDANGIHQREKGFNRSLEHLGMSDLSSRLVNGMSIDRVIRKRRQHYQFLLERISDSDCWKVCFPSLPDGICPLFFPVRVTRGSRRDLQRTLEGEGICTFVFGEHLHPQLPQRTFPEAERLSRDVLCLPVHQDLDQRHLEFIVKVMNSLRGNATDTSQAGRRLRS
jgi:perosamine synthetase